MPPKKSGPSVKSIEKQKQKIIEDKTFGMKNKNKSKKVQKEIEHIAHRVQQSGPKWTKEELEVLHFQKFAFFVVVIFFKRKENAKN